MIPEHMEPKGLDRDTPACFAPYPERKLREDAICGSGQLLRAIQKARLRP